MPIVPYLPGRKAPKPRTRSAPPPQAPAAGDPPRRRGRPSIFNFWRARTDTYRPPVKTNPVRLGLAERLPSDLPPVSVPPGPAIALEEPSYGVNPRVSYIDVGSRPGCCARCLCIDY